MALFVNKRVEEMFKLMAALLVLATPSYALTCGTWVDMHNALQAQSAVKVFERVNKKGQSIQIWQDKTQWAAFVVDSGGACIVEWGPINAT